MTYPVVQLAMGDLDVVERFRDALGVGSITLRSARANSKQLYVWHANSFENCQAAVAMMWPWLGERRRARAIEVFTQATKSQSLRLTNRQTAVCSIAGCDIRPAARNLCSKHYLSGTRSERYARTGNACVESGCERRPNGSRGRCRPHADEARALVG